MSYPFGERDAMTWTEEFDRIYPDCRPDSGTMLGWFANAIETGVMIGGRAALPVPALDAYTAEMERAWAKFGDQFDFTDTEWLAVLTEEVGESATETLRAKFFDADALFRRRDETGIPIEEGDFPLARLDKELVQVAAVAMRWRAALHARIRAALAQQEADLSRDGAPEPTGEEP